MDVAEASSRVVRLERLANDLETARRPCPDLSMQVGGVTLRVSIRLNPEVWAGPAAERAFHGYQAASTQAAWGRREVDDVDALAWCGVAAAREVAVALRQAVTAAGTAGSPVVDDAAAGWPPGRGLPPRDRIPSPLAEVPVSPGNVAGFVGVHPESGGFLQRDLLDLRDRADSLTGTLGGVVGRVGDGLGALYREVAGSPYALVDLSWVALRERLGMIGRWAHDTAVDLAWRLDAFGAGSGGEFVTATFVFADRKAASAAARADAAAIEDILGRDRVMGGAHHVTGEQIAGLSALLECSAERVYDAAYAAGVLNELGPEGVGEAMEVAARGGPETEARLHELIAAATRSGDLDPVVAAALLAHPLLDRLAVSDAALSDAFATRAAKALLDPDRPGERGMGIDGPDRGDLEAAYHLMGRYGVAVDPALLAGVAANPLLEGELVSAMLRLATMTETNRARSEATLDGVIANLGACSPEAKRALAEAVVAHMDHLAGQIHAGDPWATDTRAAIDTILDDGEARRTLADGAGAYAAAGFSEVSSRLAAVMAANPSLSAEAALAAIGDEISVTMVEISSILHALADWDGGSASEIPGLVGAGAGLVLAGAGTFVTGGFGAIAMAGVGVAAGEVTGAVGDEAAGRVGERAVHHAQSVRDTAYHVAVSALLLTPGPPPLCDLLVKVPPTPGAYPTLFENGTFVIPQPGTPAWKDFDRWVTKGGNPFLAAAVNGMLGRVGFAPGWET